MNILHDHERIAGMGRSGHVESKRICSQKGAQKLRRYGAAAVVFNAMLCLAAMPALARPPELLAFGDSLTAGYGLPAKEAFPVRLQARLKDDGIDVKMVNAGVSGDTTTDGLARLDWALADKPDFVILALGANDALRGIDPEIVRANLDAMIAKIQASGAKLLMLGMLAPSNWGADYEHAFDRIYPELAKAHDVPLYPFFLDGVAMDPALNQPDGMHPNERGVAIMVDRIAPLVAKLIDAQTAGGKS
jgi:acyl-CoA thioesterase-1